MFTNKFFRKNLNRPDWKISQKRLPNKLWLDKNELFLDSHINEFKKILKKIRPFNLSSYPDLSNLYKQLGNYTKNKVDELILTNGSDGGIRMVFDLLINQKDKILILNPTFAMYEIYCKIFKLRFKKIDYLFSEHGPHIGLDHICNTIKQYKPRLFCIPNPNSPTGTIFKIKEIKKILEISKKNKTFVLIDEAYYPISKITVKKLVRNFDNLIIVRSFSKSIGLAGLRVGYILTNKKLTLQFHKIKSMYEIGNFQAELLSLILKSKLVEKKLIKKIIQDKEYFKKELSQYGFKVLNDEGNFIHVNFGVNKLNIFKKLEKIMYFRKLESHPSLKNFSRISLTSKKNYKKILHVIKNEKKI